MNINNLFIIPEQYPNQFLYGFKKNNIPHIIQFSLLNQKSTTNVWEVKIINVNKINDIEHGKEVQFTESDTKSNNDFINLLEIAFNDFFNKVKIKPKAFVFHLPYKITINNLEIFNTKLKHILIKYFHFKYNQHSFDSGEHKWIYFSLQQNVFKVENLNEIEDIINYLYDNYIQFKSPVNISKLINKDIISQFPDINKISDNKPDNNEINNNEIDLKKWIEIFQDYDQLSFQLFNNIVPFKFIYTKSNGIGRFVDNYILDYSLFDAFNEFSNAIPRIFKELNLKYNEENPDNIENILEQLNSIQNHIPKNNLVNWFISYYTDLTTNLGFKNQFIFITSLFSKSSDLLIPYPMDILDKKDKDLSYQFYYNANPFKFNKIIQTENPIKNNLINKEFNINFLSNNFEKKIIEYKDQISTSNIEDYISISKIFKFFIESLFFPDRIIEIFSNKNKTEFVLEKFKENDSYSLGSFLDMFGFNDFCKWMNKLSYFIKKNKEFNIIDEFFFNNTIQEKMNIFEVINEEYDTFKYKQDWNLSENVNYLISKKSYLEFFYEYEEALNSYQPYFSSNSEMKNSKDFFDEWMNHLFSSSKLQNLTLNNYEDTYNFLISEFNKSKMTDTPIKNILDFNYYIKYIFNNEKYTSSVFPSLERKDGIPILNNIKFNNDDWNYYIDVNNGTFICKIFQKLLNELSLKLNISKNKLLSGIDSDIINEILDVQLNEFSEKFKLVSREYYIDIDHGMIDTFKEILIANLTEQGHFSSIEIQNRDIENINSGNIQQFDDKKTLTKEEAKKLFIRLSLWLFQDRPEIRNESFGKDFFDTMIKIIPHEYRNKIENSLSEEDKKELSLLKVFNSKIIDKTSDIELSELLKTHSDKKDYFSTLSKIQLNNLRKYERSVKKYTGSGYVSINNILRSDRMIDDDLLYEYFKDILSLFESYHYTSSLSTENIITYRGSGSDKMLYGKMAGDFIIESGFLSTTIDKQIAQEFSNKNYGNIYLFYLPKETPVLYLHKLSSHRNEEEILLPLGSVFKIISIENRRNLPDTFQSLDGGFLYRLLYIGNIGSKVLQDIINKTGTEKNYQQKLNDITSGKFLEKWNKNK